MTLRAVGNIGRTGYFTKWHKVAQAFSAWTGDLQIMEYFVVDILNTRGFQCPGTNQSLTLVIYIFKKILNKLAKQSLHLQIYMDSNCTIVLHFISGCFSNTFPSHLRKPPKHSLDGQAMTN